MAKQQYKAMNGLRALAALGIVCMHVYYNSGVQFSLCANTNILQLCDYAVFLFMMVSGFGISAGYYDSFVQDNINLERFYSRRYSKILPFFAIVVCLDLITDLSLGHIYEAIADLSLAFSLLPNPRITVVGVGWTLGVIFLFYMIYPFVVYLMKNKFRVWLTFAFCLFYHVTGTLYFLNTEHVVESFRYRGNFAYAAIYFYVGCMIYLYREIISRYIKKMPFLMLGLCLVLTILFVIVLKPETTSVPLLSHSLGALVVYSMWLMYAISMNGKILTSSLLEFIAGISMEIYLCHMMIFRLAMKVVSFIPVSGLTYYLILVVLTITGAVLFSIIVGKGIGMIQNRNTYR